MSGLGPVAQVRLLSHNGAPAGQMLMLWCPGCQCLHAVDTVAPDGSQPTGACWSWDGDLVAPTVEPSILTYSTVHLCTVPHPAKVCEDPDVCGASSHLILAPEGDQTVYGHVQPHTADPGMGNCHAFLRKGRWEFLPDSAHHLAGHDDVPMVPLPDWLVRE